MNYKYLIALFAGDEVDAWEAPKSEWMCANPDKQKWTDEFMASHGIPTKDSIFLFPHYVAIHGNGTYSSGVKVTLKPNNYIFYWNEDYKDIFILLTSNGTEADVTKIAEIIDRDPDEAITKCKKGASVWK